tara:strand:+ start:572 stop:724 length:153 start_codon:yes stop_codon:yes gene_type:complete
MFLRLRKAVEELFSPGNPGESGGVLANRPGKPCDPLIFAVLAVMFWGVFA